MNFYKYKTQIIIGIVILIIAYVIYQNYFQSGTSASENFMAGSAMFNGSKGKKFKVIFETMWGDPRVRIGYPDEPHTGTMFLSVHNQNYNPFRVGGLASKGLQQSAEYGMSDMLAAEAEAMAPNVYKYYTGPVVMTPGQQEFIIDTSDGHRYFSFITMIAPSADWFTGISSVNLDDIENATDGPNTFVKIPLYAYNAGTDAGKEFITTPKHPLSRHLPISKITNGVLFPNKMPIPFAYLKVYPMPS